MPTGLYPRSEEQKEQLKKYSFKKGHKFWNKGNKGLPGNGGYLKSKYAAQVGTSTELFKLVERFDKTLGEIIDPSYLLAEKLYLKNKELIDKHEPSSKMGKRKNAHVIPEGGTNGPVSP